MYKEQDAVRKNVFCKCLCCWQLTGGRMRNDQNSAAGVYPVGNRMCGLRTR